MKIQNRGVITALLLIFTLMIVGCNRLPSHLTEQSTSVPETLKSVQADIDKRIGAYEERKKSSDWLFLEPYASRENLADKFSQAQASIQHAKNIFDTEVTPIIQRNERKDTDDLSKKLSQITRNINTARTLSMEVSNRLQFLLDARQNADAWVQKATTDANEIKTLVSQTSKTAFQAQTDYPNKKEDIHGRLAALTKLESDSLVALKTATEELKKTGFVDYALLGDSTQKITAFLKDSYKLKSDLESKLSELYRSYSKTLVDMRVDYFVDVVRVSWDEASDWPTEHEVTFSRQVDESVYEYYDALTLDTIASYVTSWGSSLDVKIERSKWDAISISPKDSWPSYSDDQAEFYVSNTYTKTYHKYLVVENAEKKETDWQNVSEEVFFSNEENLGLTLVSKTYGMYEEETIKTAIPMGLEYIASPKMENGQPTGSNQYGFWNNGFWNWYGQYRFMTDILGGNGYSYNDWNSYNRRSKSSPYYGDDDQYGTYGSSTYTGRYNNSEYTRRNPNIRNEAKTSRRSSADVSLRNAGPTNRGKGPGGSGK